jgi:hypothetical protein
MDLRDHDRRRVKALPLSFSLKGGPEERQPFYQRVDGTVRVRRKQHH